MTEFDPHLPKSQRYYHYKVEPFACSTCGWKGIGSETKSGDLTETFVERLCPKCAGGVGKVILPTEEEVLADGPEADKGRVRRGQEWGTAYRASLLSDASQLPEIPDHDIEFVLQEVMLTRIPGDKAEGHILILYKNKVAWMEMRAYEYADRFLELAALLKQKYGSRMIDLIPDGGGSDALYGDDMGAGPRVDGCRTRLCETGPRVEGLCVPGPVNFRETEAEREERGKAFSAWRMKTKNFHIYRGERFTCSGCGWSNTPEWEKRTGVSCGIGYIFKHDEEEEDESEQDPQLRCGNCGRNITFTDLSDFAETLKHGSEQERAFALNLRVRRERHDARVKAWNARWEASLLKDARVLPEIDEDGVVIILRELRLDPQSRDMHIVLTHKRRVIWKELLKEPYFERFFELATLLKQKYGERLVDIVGTSMSSKEYGPRGQSAEVYRRAVAFRTSLDPLGPFSTYVERENLSVEEFRKALVDNGRCWSTEPWVG